LLENETFFHAVQCGVVVTEGAQRETGWSKKTKTKTKTKTKIKTKQKQN
jgi:hypothetical protein